MIKFRHLLLLACVISSSISYGQLKIYGTVYSNGPVRTSFKIEGLNKNNFLYLDPKANTTIGGEEVRQTKYSLPWSMSPEYNYTIKFTDGTVEKEIYVRGAVPNGLIPKQKFVIDIDLTDDSEDKFVVMWSRVENSYVAIPLSEMELISEKGFTPRWLDKGEEVEQ